MFLQCEWLSAPADSLPVSCLWKCAVCLCLHVPVPPSQGIPLSPPKSPPLPLPRSCQTNRSAPFLCFLFGVTLQVSGGVTASCPPSRWGHMSCLSRLVSARVSHSEGNPKFSSKLGKSRIRFTAGRWKALWGGSVWPALSSLPHISLLDFSHTHTAASCWV